MQQPFLYTIFKIQQYLTIFTNVHSYGPLRLHYFKILAYTSAQQKFKEKIIKNYSEA